MPSKEIEGLKEERERLRQEHAAGASGLSIARSLADAVDSAIRAIWGRLDRSATSTVVAVGGYGRGLMSPASDVDILILQPKKGQATSAAKALSYELWDAGLEVGGSSVRTLKEALVHARQNFDAETAFIDARYLAGDETLFTKWHEGHMAQIRKSMSQFLERIRESTDLRRRHSGDVGADLEPNLKEGRGGLRDLATLGWLDRLHEEPATIERELIEAGAEILFRIRNELHFSTGRHTDVLSMPLQAQVAVSLRWPDRDGLSPEDILMRDLYISSRAIAFECDVRLDPSMRLQPEPLIEILRRGVQGKDAFRALEQSGELVRLIPQWKHIWCMPQRNIYHRYAVDIHSFEVVVAVANLKQAEDELIHRVAEDAADDWDVLLISALLHDIGKGTQHDHSERGEELSRSAVAHFDLPPEQAEDVVWLVGNHLALAKSATRRDIGDERTIVEFAERVKSQRRLRLLYLLTIADAVATGPAAWGQWKATLVSRLFTRVNHLLEAGELVGSSASGLAHERSDELRQALREFEAGFVTRHLENMPRAWLLSQPIEALVEQSKLMLEPPVGDEVLVKAIPQSDAGVWEVVVVARDRPGLFSKISGALALHGLNVLGAQIFTREDGVALEVFRVEALGDEAHRFERVARDAEKAIRGRLSLEVRLDLKRKDYSFKVPKGKQVPPQVVVDNRASDFYTVIEVHAPDRVGLLYTITRALADLELDIHLAKVATYGEDVVDAFYVRDLYGQKIEDPDHIEEIRQTVIFRLERDG